MTRRNKLDRLATIVVVPQVLVACASKPPPAAAPPPPSTQPSVASGAVPTAPATEGVGRPGALPVRVAAPDDAVLAWLGCEDECDDLLAAVVTTGKAEAKLNPAGSPWYGRKTSEQLVSVLFATAIDPDAASQAAHLRRTYQALKAREANRPGRPIAITEEQFVELYARQRRALRQARAAEALLRIGGPELPDALGAEAKKLNLPAGTQSAIKSAIDAARKTVAPH